MRRIVSVVAMAALMAAILVALALPALAQEDGKVCIQSYPESLLCELGLPSPDGLRIPPDVQVPPVYPLPPDGGDDELDGGDDELQCFLPEKELCGENGGD
ncbi:MAG: hypothetical protein M3N18_11170 [Actinomycetota bacterium]|nr:hypothetical protein [Actinomycetota bacterium]